MGLGGRSRFAIECEGVRAQARTYLDRGPYGPGPQVRQGLIWLD